MIKSLYLPCCLVLDNWHKGYLCGTVNSRNRPVNFMRWAKYKSRNLHLGAANSQLHTLQKVMIIWVRAQICLACNAQIHDKSSIIFSKSFSIAQKVKQDYAYIWFIFRPTRLFHRHKKSLLSLLSKISGSIKKMWFWRKRCVYFLIQKKMGILIKIEMQ